MSFIFGGGGNEVAVRIVDIDKCSDFLTRIGQEFNDRFNDFEPCVMFTSKPFMEVDVGDISEQISVPFDLDYVPLEMERLLSAFKMTCS